MIEEERLKPGSLGCIKWFDSLPDNLLKTQECYRTPWNEIRSKKLIIR
ncbi:hypothetical protein DSBG_4092 [Desulfosporosinus sp. BG]|nr:hypothetical protein DSBG_4092 [Desulfosporosinus sp. BG]